MARTADETIMMRVKKAHKEQIKRAADMVGQSVSVFMLQAALIEAMQIEQAFELREQSKKAKREEREHGN